MRFQRETHIATLLPLSIFFVFTFLFISCAPYHSTLQPMHYSAKGKASWYGPGFAGRKTANGEIYNPNALTAAHKTLPFGTTVEVKNTNNNKSTIVRINDRGPYVKGRIIDLSKAAAKQIGMIKTGTAIVDIKALSAPSENQNTEEKKHAS